MSNRYTQLTPASFNPLSVEEIMMVPLAKQARHDQMQMASMQEGMFDNPYLDTDRGIVEQEMSGIKQGLADIEEELATKGISNGITRKMLGLKRKKMEFLSPSGIGGKAASNYTGYQQNVKDIMQNDATPQEKMMQIRAAKAQYESTGGVAEGASYNPYMGFNTYDIPEFLMEVGSNLEPFVEQTNSGWRRTADGKMWTNGTTKTTTLPVDVIQTVLMNAAMGNPELMSYLQEKGRVTPGFNPQGELINAVRGASGQFMRRDIEKDIDMKFTPQYQYQMGNAPVGRFFDRVLSGDAPLPDKFNPSKIKGSSEDKDWVIYQGLLGLPSLAKRAAVNPEKVITSLWGTSEAIKNKNGVYAGTFGFIPNPLYNPGTSETREWWLENHNLDVRKPAENKKILEVLSNDIAFGSEGIGIDRININNAAEAATAKRRADMLLSNPGNEFMINGEHSRTFEDALDKAEMDPETTEIIYEGSTMWENSLSSLLPPGSRNKSQEWVTPHSLLARDKAGKTTRILVSGVDSEVNPFHVSLNREWNRMRNTVGENKWSQTTIYDANNNRHKADARYLASKKFIRDIVEPELKKYKDTPRENIPPYARNLMRVAMEAGHSGVIEIKMADGKSEYLSPQELENNWAGN